MPGAKKTVSSLEKFRQISSQPKFLGWPMVGDYEFGPKIDFFGQPINYKLRTGNGVESYSSIIRHFGWSVVFGVTAKNEVITLVQWKPGVNCATWELPPGGIGRIAPGTDEEEILHITKEVYLRETGFGGGQWKPLAKLMVESGKYRGAGPNDHGLPAHLFLATDLQEIGQARQPNRNEIMETLMVPIHEFYRIIESGSFNEISAVPCALLALIQLGI